MNICITGAAGYVGGMLCDQFSKRDDVEYIVAIDKDPQPSLLEGNDKVVWINANTADDTWQGAVAQYAPTVLVNCAWQIREMYGNQAEQWRWNIEGCNNVYDFVFGHSSIKRFVHFSTVSSYGAYHTNTLDYITEERPFTENSYLYGVEKRVAEENLEKKYKEARQSQIDTPQVFIIRPQAITGPRGRYMFERFGLLAALQGGNGAIPGFVKRLVSVVPVTHKWWSRQFIHEDDVCDIVSMFTFRDDLVGEYEAFNIGSDSYVDAATMSHLTGKRIVRIPAFVARVLYWCLWHGTRGRVPTAHGGWRFYTYPVVVSGKKLTDMHGYHYRCTGPEALGFTNGRYESYVPEDKQKHNDQLDY